MVGVKIYDPDGGWINLETAEPAERVIAILNCLKGTYAVVTETEGRVVTVVTECGDVPE